MGSERGWGISPTHPRLTHSLEKRIRISFSQFARDYAERFRKQAAASPGRSLLIAAIESSEKAHAEPPKAIQKMGKSENSAYVDSARIKRVNQKRFLSSTHFKITCFRSNARHPSSQTTGRPSPNVVTIPAFPGIRWKQMNAG
jgi:hypothetical protein